MTWMRSMYRAYPALFITLIAATACGADREEAVERAVRFLAREVPRWSAENKCYSCHNNGDAARALYTAARDGFPLDDMTLADTTQWLVKPTGWEHNGGEGEFNDTKLAAIQFAHSLLTSIETEAVENKPALTQAAKIVAEFQDADGCWTIEPKTALGAPATYGTPLATAVSLRILIAADSEQYRERIKRGRSWLRTIRPRSVVDASGVLLGLRGATGEAAEAQRQRCLEKLKSAQGESGGWGSYPSAPPEPFDTAISLLALQQSGEFSEKSTILDRGRRFLLEAQRSDGSWRETTRPSGSVSYAQRLSTTGWCTLALLATTRN